MLYVDEAQEAEHFLLIISLLACQTQQGARCPTQVTMGRPPWMTGRRAPLGDKGNQD